MKTLFLVTVLMILVGCKAYQGPPPEVYSIKMTQTDTVWSTICHYHPGDNPNNKRVYQLELSSSDEFSNILKVAYMHPYHVDEWRPYGVSEYVFQIPIDDFENYQYIYGRVRLMSYFGFAPYRMELASSNVVKVKIPIPVKVDFSALVTR